MVATVPTKSFRAFSVKRNTHAPDLAHFRKNYPETVASLGTLPRREEWLRRIWELESRWRNVWETSGGEGASMEALVRGRPPAGSAVEGEFDVVYAGGALAVLHAASLACGYNRRALVLYSDSADARGGSWNLSNDELKALAALSVFNGAEVESAVVNRCRGGFVKFHDAASRVKAEPLWVSGPMDVAVDGEHLLSLAAERLRGREDCAVVEGLSFVRAYMEPARVTIEAEDAAGTRRFFGARLFIDAGSADSAVARQLNNGRAPSHVCPTVGTIARGFVRGAERDSVDFGACEILVSTEDVSDHRQLFWESSAGSAERDEYATRLFFFDAAGSRADKSLLALFERYFESLPAYKRRRTNWRVERPMFGYAAVAQPTGWRKRRRTADGRVMLLGDAAGGASGLASRGFGAALKDLRRVAHLTHLALEAGLSEGEALAQISDGGPRVAEAVGLAEFLRPAPHSAPQSVNETLNALVAAVGGLDECVRRELFQGRISLDALRRLLSRTAQIYPRIFARVREHFGARGTFWWLAGIADALWSERRVRARGIGGETEDSEREFARVAALYRSGGADDSSGAS